MGERIDDTALDTLFREARTYATWQPRPVDDQALRELYELLKWAPTSANAAPARFAFLRSTEAKERLRPSSRTSPSRPRQAACPCPAGCRLDDHRGRRCQPRGLRVAAGGDRRRHRTGRCGG